MTDRGQGGKPAEKKAGVREVAAAAGLSVATVSRVINDAPNVRKETRERVTRAMKELGFTPNPLARAFSTRRTHTIAAVIPTLEHSIFARFLNAIELELAARGYALVMAISDNDPRREFLRARALLDMGAEGMILSGAKHSKDLLQLITTRSVPTVCTSIYAPEYGLPTIGYDNHGLAVVAVSYLRSLGHEQIAVIHGPLTDNDRTVLRIEGAKSVIQSEDRLLLETSLNVQGGADAAGDLLKLDVLPTAVLCLSDVIALGALFELKRLGVRVPEDISLMGFDDLDWAPICDPPLTSISLPTSHMGEAAARALVRQLDYQTPIEDTLLNAEIVKRASTSKSERK